MQVIVNEPRSGDDTTRIVSSEGTQTPAVQSDVVQKSVRFCGSSRCSGSPG